MTHPTVTTGIETLSQLQELAHAWQEGNRDDTVRADCITYDVDASDRNHSLDRLYFPSVENDSELAEFFGIQDGSALTGLSDRGFAQLCGRLDVPVQWAKRSPRELRELVMNWNLKNPSSKFSSKEFLLRQRDGAVRAVLSNQYEIFNHSSFVDLLIEAVTFDGAEIADQLKVDRVYMGDNFRAFLYVPIDFGNGDGGNEQTRGLYPGLTFGNSEVGEGRWYASPSIYQLVCKNGAMAWKSAFTVSGIHRGKSQFVNTAIVSEKLTEALAFSQEMAERFVYQATVKVKRNKLTDLLATWSNRIDEDDLTEVENRSQGSALVTGEITMFDVISNITEMAQQKPFDVTHEYEKLAGELIFADVPEQFVV
jgi:hypothetical protein